MANTERGPDGLRAVERTMAVLTALTEHPHGASLTDIVRITGIPTTTLHRLLGVLRGTALVRETPDGRYALAAGTMTLARAFLDGLDLRQEARAAMRGLAGETGETCHLGVLAVTHVVYIEKIDSPHPVRMYSRVGSSNPALTTAIGRAVLAYSPEHVVTEAVEASARLTGEPAQDVGALLAAVRHHGYATDLQENEAGICCLGAPVFDHAGRVVAGLSVSMPATRFDAGALPKTGALVRATADDLSRRMGWNGTVATSGDPGDFPLPPPAPRPEPTVL
ncbi:IclR family transcriptional regulator [Phytohabitans sp. ZYX-F-186]|uniref:IclR family transcriptional regulator n=1 Tax=Phytohabitans maris TaxID=3071409 RepID=A0ABU0ZR12_9ACTN|nr:IclR family transcriptional regulator [Phytohabitans sp. ZYX-F-186]MDQ7909398.1 IclR family transcriptional regulator [Phytohabitans sp. ZYX-F-186]